MRNVFWAAVAVTICAGPTTVFAEDKKPSQSGNLIRRELRVDPNDATQAAQALMHRSIKKCSQPTGCVQPDTPPTARPRVRSLLQNSPP